MKIVVFGGSGFLGSHVTDALMTQGHEVTVFDLKAPPRLAGAPRLVIGDILDGPRVLETLKQADCAYHFAGLADLDDATTRPLETVKQNIMGTVTILDAAVQAGLKRFIYASTIYVYSRLGGFYRCSKQAGELYVEEYQRRYNLPYTILRYGTLYGPRSDRRNSIWRYLHQALTEKKIVFHGRGDENREYVHVRDAARLSVEILADAYQNAHTIITGHHPMKALDMLTMIKEILNNDVSIEFANTINAIHYTLTPYSFMPQVGKKLVSNCYEDMGQGLLECIHEIAEELGKKGE